LLLSTKGYAERWQPIITTGMKDIRAKVKYNRVVASNTYLMALDLGPEPFKPKPGQFVMLRVGHTTDPLLRRPFSIAGVDSKGSLHILYRVVGKATALMSQWSPGVKTWALGPLGKGFDLGFEKDTAIIVAGGIGVAPLIFLAQRIDPTPMIFLLGAKTKDELIANEILPKKGVDLKISTDDGSMGYHGPVTGLFEEALTRVRPRKTIVFACGPEPMLRQVACICSLQGVRCQVSLEAAMACGVGACLGCALKVHKGSKPSYAHVCKDGPVFDGDEIVP